MDISFLIHDKPPRSVKPSPGTPATVPSNKGSESVDVAADIGTGNVKRSHAQMTGETLSTDEGREPKKPRVSERSSPMHGDAFNLQASNASLPLPAEDVRRVVMPALPPYILGATNTATSPIPPYVGAGNMPAQHWQLPELTHAASVVGSASHFTTSKLPTPLPSHMPFPSLNGMPWVWVASTPEASAPMPNVSTQGDAEAMLGTSTASLSGADNGGMDPHALIKFANLYEQVQRRSVENQVQASKEKPIVLDPMWKASEERKVKDPAKRSDPRSALPRNTYAALPLLDQLQAAESGSSVVAQRWKRLQPALDKFLMSCAMFTKPEEFADYLAVVQIAVLYLDAPLGNGTSWQAEAVIADVLVLLARWASRKPHKREAKSEQEKSASPERCKTAMRESLFGVDRDGKRVDHALSARFIQLLIKVYHFQFTEQRLSKLYERPLSNGRDQLPLVSAAKAARSFLEKGEYKALSCKDLAQAYFDKGNQSELVHLIWNDLGLHASNFVPAVPLITLDWNTGRVAQAITTSSSPSFTTTGTTALPGGGHGRAHEESGPGALHIANTPGHQADRI